MRREQKKTEKDKKRGKILEKIERRQTRGAREKIETIARNGKSIDVKMAEMGNAEELKRVEEETERGIMERITEIERKNEELKKKLERLVEVMRGWREERTKYKEEAKEEARKWQELEKKLKSLEGRIEMLEREEDKRREKDALRREKIDKEKTVVLKWGPKYNGMPVGKWLESWLGKGRIEFKIAQMAGAARRMQWLMFEDGFLKKFLLQKYEEIYKEGIYTVDEVLTPEERKERWLRQQAEREAKEAETKTSVASRLRRPREERMAEQGSGEMNKKGEVKEETNEEAGKEEMRKEQGTKVEEAEDRRET